MNLHDLWRSKKDRGASSSNYIKNYFNLFNPFNMYRVLDRTHRQCLLHCTLQMLLVVMGSLPVDVAANYFCNIFWSILRQSVLQWWFHLRIILIESHDWTEQLSILKFQHFNMLTVSFFFSIRLILAVSSICFCRKNIFLMRLNYLEYV